MNIPGLPSVDMSTVQGIFDAFQKQMQGDGINPLALLNQFTNNESKNVGNYTEQPTVGQAENQFSQGDTPDLVIPQEKFGESFINNSTTSFIFGFFSNYLMLLASSKLEEFLSDESKNKGDDKTEAESVGSRLEKLIASAEPIGKYGLKKKRRAARPSNRKELVSTNNEQVEAVKGFVNKWVDDLDKANKSELGLAGAGNIAANLFNLLITENFITQLSKFVPFIKPKGSPNHLGQMSGRAVGLTAGGITGLFTGLYLQKETAWVIGGIVALTYLASGFTNRTL